MKRSSILFVAILSAGSLAGYSEACGGNGGGNKFGGFGGVGGPGGAGGGISFSKGGFTVSTGGLNRGGGGNFNNNGGGRGCNNGGGGYNNGGGVYNGNNGGQYFGQAYEPFHSYYVVQPGDSFYTVSLKEYGTSSAANHIARFNRLAGNAALVPGQRLLLPSVSAGGRFTQSRAPAPTTEAPVTAAASTPKFAPAATTTTTTPATETSEPLPKLATGSVISLDGQDQGTEQGVVRLRLAGVSFPVEVLEWTANSAKVRLPKLEITEDTKCVLEVLKADGTLASSNGIELTSADSNLAKN